MTSSASRTGSSPAATARRSSNASPRSWIRRRMRWISPSPCGSGRRSNSRCRGSRSKELEKKDLVPFLGDSGYDEALVLQSIERIRRYFQEKGHYRVVVNRTEERSPEVVRLAFEVVPGPRLTLDEVRFEGNTSYDPERLRRLMTTSARRFLLPGSGRLVDEELSADLSNLRSFYQLEGFDRSQVGPARIVEQGDRLEVVVPIAEGRCRRVGELVLQDLAPLDESAARKALALESGGPFHRLLLERSVDTLRALLEDRGYGGALVSSEVVWSADDLVATVRLRVFAGDRWVFDRTLLRGLRRTDPSIVRRFLGIAPGDPVRQAAVLDLQRRLYGLGIFSRVDVRVAPSAEGGGARAPGRPRGGPIAVGAGGRRLRLGERRARPVAPLAGEPLRQGDLAFARSSRQPEGPAHAADLPPALHRQPPGRAPRHALRRARGPPRLQRRPPRRAAGGRARARALVAAGVPLLSPGRAPGRRPVLQLRDPARQQEWPRRERHAHRRLRSPRRSARPDAWAGTPPSSSNTPSRRSPPMPTSSSSSATRPPTCRSAASGFSPAARAAGRSNRSPAVPRRRRAAPWRRACRRPSSSMPAAARPIAPTGVTSWASSARR